jgi:hypothetical protein
VAQSSADWSRLAARAELIFFADAFGSEDDAALALADFDMILTMRERTAFPESLIRRLPKLRMIGITGPSNPTVDVEACTRQGVTVCNTPRSSALYRRARDADQRSAFLYLGVVGVSRVANVFGRAFISRAVAISNRHEFRHLEFH